MQGKGASAVNRVELECQVLCSALRQSWVRQDKVGAFTSIRELSHLFPDLLPPPEDRNGTNKANYYEVLSVRPGSGLNALSVAYLKSVRGFLKEHNPKDYRLFFITVLNAGFVLRKPRLRLSHDLVVARRWLYESQLEEAAERAYVEPVAEEVPGGVPAEAGQPAAEPVGEQEQPGVQEHFGVEEEQPDEQEHFGVEEEPPGAQEHFGVEEQAGAADQEAPAPEYAGAEYQEEELEVPLTPLYEEVPEAGALQEASAEEEAGISAAAETLPAAGPPEEEYDALEIIRQSWEQAKVDEWQPQPSFQMPPPAHMLPEAVEPVPPVMPLVPPPAPPVPPSAPAAVTEPAPQPVQPVQTKAGQAAESRPFHFDESQLRKPEAEMELPSVVRLMEAARLITKVEVQALKAQMQLAPNIPVDQLVLNAGYASRNELNSIHLAEDLLAAGKINMAQFQVAMYDERTSGLKMAESLQVRGWLETEVRNPIEEFKKPES